MRISIVCAKRRRRPRALCDPVVSRTLITGANGFVGPYLRSALVTRWPDIEVIGTGISPLSGPSLDLCDASAVNSMIADIRPDVVVHLAAQASIGALGHQGDEQTWRVNLGGTLNLALALARFAPNATFLFPSSSEVYGRAFGATPVSESTPPQPRNAYSQSKILGERLLDNILPQTARLIVARPFNHSGPGQREDFVLASWAGQIARIERGLQAPVMLVGNLDVARDFLDVRDVVAAYCMLIEAAPRLPARTTVNIASGSARPLRDLLAIFQLASHVPFGTEVDPVRTRPSDIPFACGDAERLRTLTGWQPAISIETTLGDLLDSARKTVGNART